MVPDAGDAGGTVHSRDCSRQMVIPYNQAEALVTFVDYGVGLGADQAVEVLVPRASYHGVQLVGLTLQDPLVLHSHGKVTFIDLAASKPVTEAGVQSRQVQGCLVVSGGEVPPATYAIIQLSSLESSSIKPVLDALPLGASKLAVGNLVLVDQVLQTGKMFGYQFQRVC